MHTTPIAYIAGLGHSGSTLLDLLVSSHSQIVSVGEIKNLASPSEKVRRRKVLEETRCPCGEPSVMTCPFWRDVERDLGDAYGLSLYSLDMNSPDRETFRAHNEALYKSVATVSGAKCVLDSSKDSDRLDRLIHLTDLDIRPIHLIRSPFGTVYSNRKKGRAAISFAYVYTQNVLYTSIVVGRKPHRLVKYEDLVERPSEMVAGLLHWLQLSFEPSQIHWTEHEHHNIGGNRMRYGKQSTIRADEAWKSNMTLFDKFGIALLTLPARIPRSLVSWVFHSIAGVRHSLRRRQPKQ